LAFAWVENRLVTFTTFSEGESAVKTDELCDTLFSAMNKLCGAKVTGSIDNIISMLAGIII